ncbi:MAG: hypothetical protein L3K06_06875, partial [Thermoplasmata archaeon]|nr:hypothetical protein [Thermoplasmata archaeon]
GFNLDAFHRIEPATDLRAVQLVAGANHLLVGNASRNILVSDDGRGDIWDPTIKNSADTYDLGIGRAITGVAETADGAVFATDSGMYYFRTSGSIPPFVVTQVDRRGTRSGIAMTPLGPVFVGPQDAHVAGLAQGIASRIGPYLVGYEVFWHEGQNAILFTTGSDAVYMDPATGAVWRTTLPHAQFQSAMVQAEDPSAVWTHYFLATDARLYRESVPDLSAMSPVAGAVVDTKDFAFQSPCETDYIRRIKVDWEPLTNATTDAIEVLAYPRNDLFPGLLGGVGMQFDLTANFVSQGVLTAGASELYVNLQGKYARFRFKQKSGRARVRGFTIERERGGDR